MRGFSGGARAMKLLLMPFLLSHCAQFDLPMAAFSHSSPQVSWSISGVPSAGPLMIERIELVFDNGFSQITVDQHNKLNAQARLNFGGSGPLVAEWRVDGRIIERVNRMLGFGTQLTLSLSDGSVLPVFQPGSHEITLIILQPLTSLRMPVIRYFVTLPASLSNPLGTLLDSGAE